MMITVLYFARLKEALGKGSEQIDLPAGISTVGGVSALLATREGVWAHEFAAGRAVRAAVNQDLAGVDTPVKDGDEVAFFPPVTGG
jgi:molybdopterin synthase sulfur carrier subunit